MQKYGFENCQPYGLEEEAFATVRARQAYEEENFYSYSYYTPTLDYPIVQSPPQNYRFRGQYGQEECSYSKPKKSYYYECQDDGWSYGSMVGRNFQKIE